jgi:FtsH-binding integral membrane protein
MQEKLGLLRFSAIIFIVGNLFLIILMQATVFFPKWFSMTALYIIPIAAFFIALFWLKSASKKDHQRYGNVVLLSISIFGFVAFESLLLVYGILINSLRMPWQEINIIAYGALTALLFSIASLLVYSTRQG